MAFLSALGCGIGALNLAMTLSCEVPLLAGKPPQLARFVREFFKERTSSILTAMAFTY